MKDKELESWLNSILPKHETLTTSVVHLTKSLLDSHDIEYLTITGRTKDRASIIEKVKRKSYTFPKTQLTDLSGIRIITYLESEIEKISNIIRACFNVDATNSLSQADKLAKDQIGYRSVHFVCDLGAERTNLPEFRHLKNLKFEFQIRTVLQHAWAELAHDRNYKFSAGLPKHIERKLFLYAGMLEIADLGFQELSNEIDIYINDFNKKTDSDDLVIDINAISLIEFVEKWAGLNNFKLDSTFKRAEVNELVTELKEFEVYSIQDLVNIIHPKYAQVALEFDYSTNIFGLLRDWMLINNYQKYYNNVKFSWRGLDSENGDLFQHLLNENDCEKMYDLFNSPQE